MSEISLWGVVAGGLISMIIGFLWYSPMLFGNKFMALMEWSKDTQEMKDSSKTPYIWSAVLSLLMSLILSYFIHAIGATTLFAGAQIGFLLWLGFMIPITATTVLYENRSKGLFLLNNGYHLVVLLVVGGVIAQWF